MRFPFRSFVLLLMVALSFATVPQSARSNDTSLLSVAKKISIPGVHNAGEVTEHLYRGAQPILGELPELRKLGITTVVDLRAEFPSTAEQERLQVEALGMRFVRIPIDGFSNPRSSDLAAFFRLLHDSPPETIFVHCQFGKDRTGVMVAAYRIAVEHWTSDQALSEMFAFGFNRIWHPSMETFIRNLPDRLRTDPELRKALDPS
jgi:tyrosine-protein phosphatase SIW14